MSFAIHSGEVQALRCIACLATMVKVLDFRAILVTNSRLTSFSPQATNLVTLFRHALSSYQVSCNF